MNDKKEVQAEIALSLIIKGIKMKMRI